MNIVIVGDGKVGYTLAAYLAQEKHDVTIVDQDETALEKASETLAGSQAEQAAQAKAGSLPIAEVMSLISGLLAEDRAAQSAWEAQLEKTDQQLEQQVALLTRAAARQNILGLPGKAVKRKGG